MRALPLLAPTLALLTALLAGCASGPDPTQIAVQNLDVRVARLERVVSGGSLVQLAQQEEILQAQVRDLRGRVDQLERDNQQLAQRQHTLNADFGKRVRELGHGGGAAANPQNGAPPGVTPEQETLYRQAFEALQAGHYADAMSGFGNFVTQYGTSPLAPNAEYWLGEAQYVNQNYPAAEQAFRAVLKQWPQSFKAPDAILDLGNTLIAQGKTTEGRTTLAQLVKRYPDSDAARRAASALSETTSQ